MENSDNILMGYWEQVMEEMSDDSERAAAIVGAAILEEQLGKVLEKLIIDDEEAYNDLLKSGNISAPLSSFGARINASYAFAQINKDKRDALRKIAKIRNRFAHKVNKTFNDQDISDICKELPKLVDNVDVMQTEPRLIYIAAVTFLGGWLDAAILQVSNGADQE